MPQAHGGPHDAALAVVEADVGPYGGEVGEGFRVDLGEWLRAGGFDQRAHSGGGGVASIVPASEGGDKDRVAKGGFGVPAEVLHDPTHATGRVRSRLVAATISAATVVDDELVEAFAALIPQLSSSSPPPSATELADIVNNENSVLFIARLDDGQIVGSLTLAFYRIPTGLKAWIEDVVVDDAARGHGVGEALNRAAIDEARQRGAKNVSLTSRASREAANRLYQRLGFVQYETNLYRFALDD